MPGFSLTCSVSYPWKRLLCLQNTQSFETLLFAFLPLLLQMDIHSQSIRNLEGSRKCSVWSPPSLFPILIYRKAKVLTTSAGISQDLTITSVSGRHLLYLGHGRTSFLSWTPKLFSGLRDFALVIYTFLISSFLHRCMADLPFSNFPVRLQPFHLTVQTITTSTL